MDSEEDLAEAGLPVQEYERDRREDVEHGLLDLGVGSGQFRLGDRPSKSDISQRRHRSGQNVGVGEGGIGKPQK